jgi:ABC-type multidrug transport system fused ATPase/permease subunit
MRDKWQLTTIGRSARILPPKDQRKILAVVVLQISFGLLDLLGVAVIGVLGALAINGVGSREPGNRVAAGLEFLHINNYSLQTQATILGLVAAGLLICKTCFSIFFTRRILFFLSRKGAELSSNLISKLFSQSLLTVQARSMNEIMYSVTSGVTTITVGVLGTAVTLVADISLLLVMAAGLFILDPMIAISTIVVFVPIGLLLYRLMHQKARNLGILQSKIGIRSSESILEVISSYRETVVRNRRDYYAREIGKQRMEFADISAELSFLPNISKYVLEITVVIGFLVVSALKFVANDATHAVAGLAVFLAASTRIAPAVLRIQQGAISIKSSLGGSAPTLDLIELLGDSPRVPNTNDVVDTIHSGFSSKVELNDVSLTYPTKETPAISNITLEVEEGQIVAIVGPSGAGKTTLIDVLLGVLNPDSGTVLISGLEPLACVSKWPGAVSYVPQDVMISNGTIRSNVSLGYPETEEHEKLIWEALKVAQLEDFVRTLPGGLDAPVGDRGTKISGGQRQRLGIARAMFTRPMLLVLDEATSSLDGETEANISISVQELRGLVTVVLIAHRLSTVRNADLVVYMDRGQIISTGTFEEVRASVPEFDRQASLMGL